MSSPLPPPPPPTLTLAGAGNTALSLLLARPPAWLSSPTPWLVYPPVYLLLVPTGLAARAVHRLPPVLIDTLAAAVDALSRGAAIASIGPMAHASGKFPAHPTGQRAEISPWTYAILSALAVSAGGFLVSLFSLHEPAYRLAVPSVFRRGAGAWATMDVWAAGLAGLGYWAMVTLRVEDVQQRFGVAASMANGEAPLMHSLAARTVCVLFLGSVLVLRAVRCSYRGARKKVTE